MRAAGASAIAIGLIVLPACLSRPGRCQGETAAPAGPAQPEPPGSAPSQTGPWQAGTAKNGVAETEPAKTEPAQTGPAKTGLRPTHLFCKALRGDLGIFEPMRYMSITIDAAKRQVKVVHEGDGKTIEYDDGVAGARGLRNFVKVTDETIVYGQGSEIWKIDRYTGTLTSSALGIPFECQLRPKERKF